MNKHAHCSWCGQSFAEGLPFPRRCVGCGNFTYVNPIPVAVCLLPVDGGLLCVRRAIPPGQGKLALPGGFIDLHETWQEAAARELYEETGIRINPAEILHFRTLSSRSRDGVILIFGRAIERTLSRLPAFLPTSETSELVVIAAPEELAFPLHTEAVRDYFAERGPA